MKLLSRICLFWALVLLISCSDKNAIHVVQKNFTTEIDPSQNIILTLDKDIAVDSLIDRWLDDSLLLFEPQVRGKYKFISSREISFAPESGFAANTEYSIQLSEALLKYAPKKYTISKKSVMKVRTPEFIMTSAHAAWAADTNAIDAPYVKLAMHFSYALDPGELKASLKLTAGNREYKYNVMTSQASNDVVVVINDITDLEGNTLKLNFAEGFKPNVQSRANTKPLEYTLTVPAKSDLEVAEVKTDIDGTRGIIHVYTTQQVWMKTLEGHYALNPSKPTTCAITDFGFDITGEFNPGESYELTVGTDVRGVVGGKLREPYKASVYFGEVAPNISFPNKSALYLSGKGDHDIAVNITGIPKVSIRIYKIYENNIERFLSGVSSYDYDGESSYNYYGELSDLADVVYDKEIETKNLPKFRNTRLLHLNTDERRMYKGIYYIQLRSNNDYYNTANKLVSVSDIGLIVKQGKDHVMICANSIATAQPLAGVRLNLVSSNNQTMTTVSTNPEGVALVKNLSQLAPGFRLSMVTATQGEDFNYISLGQSHVETSRFDVSGTYENETGLQAFLYGDRDLYRPGETIHLNTIIRNAKWEPVPDLPVKIKVLMPNGSELAAVRKNLNEQGAASLDVNTSAGNVTGVYTVEVYSGNDVLLQSKSLNVEEFMPDRIKVSLKTDKEDYKPGDEITLNVQADNLFGTPASGRNCKTQVTFVRQYFSSKKFPDYVFNIHNENVVNSLYFDNKSDNDGKVEQKIKIPEEYADMGKLQARIFTTVFDENGRPVNRVKNIDIFTQEVFYGIRNSSYYNDTQKPLTFSLVGVDKTGTAKSSEAEVTVIRHEWYSVIEKYGDQARYVSHSMDKTILSKTIQVNGETPVTFTPTVSGEYEIRIQRSGSSSYSYYTLYCYGWGYTDNSSFEVNHEGNVDIEFDKEKYNVGDQARVLFKTPFSGRLLVTVERNNVLDYYFLTTDKKSAELKLNIKEEYLPNIYVSATLFRAVDDQAAMPLTVAHGYAGTKVEKTMYKMNVQIMVAEKSRSQTKQNILVKTGQPNADVTIAVVDEGILQIKNFETPDPYKFFFSRRALQVNGYDVYPFLFPEYGKQLASGGDGYDLKNRVNPLPNKRVNLVALWSGVLHTDGAGNASWRIDIPQFSGDLRVMAVAYKNKTFGSDEKHIKVADPIVLSSSLPRFCSPGDEVNMYVTLSNTTGKQASVSINAKAEGALQINEGYKTVTIAAMSESVVFFTLGAKNTMGTGKVNVTASAFGEQFKEETNLTVRPAASLQKYSDMGIVEAGSSATVDMKDAFIPQSRSARLVVSRSPVMALGKHIRYLLGYPHGCVEQTVSRAFPQIYFADMVTNMYGSKSYMRDGENELNPKYNVQEAIKKLELMQMYDGGMSYWPGGDYYNWWGSVYTAHFLVEARKAGFDVNNNTLNKLFDFMNERMKNKETEDYRYYNGGNIIVRKYAKREIIYSLYVMALSGKARVATMNYYKQNIDLVSQDMRYMLAAAYYYSGDKNSYEQIIPNAFEEDFSVNSWGGCFYSPIRNEAIALNSILDVNPSDKQVAGMVRHLIQQVKIRNYLNTQEAAFTFLALGKLSRHMNAGKASASIVRDGKNVGTFSGNDISLKTADCFGETTIKADGSSAVYYFYESEGLPADGSFKEEDRHLQVRRTYLNQFGGAINGPVKQNDLVVVKITLRSDAEYTENIVITDMLPAGLEIENPRLTETNELPWIKDRESPQYIDVRDDRINMYTFAGMQPRTFYYLCRAVTKGNFVVGPVSADAMYNYDFRSYNGAGKLVVE